MNAKKECSYIEVVGFFDYIFDENFKICECPDKVKVSEYTCDMVLMSNDKKEKIYLEVKFGFGKEKRALIAENNGQLEYANLVSDIIDEIGKKDIEKRKRLDDFIITIPKRQIYIKEKQMFYDGLAKFINDNSFLEEQYIYCYERQKETIEIVFERSKDEKEKFGNKVLFAYEVEEDNTLDSILKKLTDIENLNKLLVQNANNTSAKKFLKTNDRKILINILKIPTGYDIFFNSNLNYIIDKIISKEVDYKSAADESYLL